MKKSVAGALAGLLLGVAGTVAAADSVTGWVSIKGTKTTLKHAYGKWSMKEMQMGRVVLSDAPLPAEALDDYAKLMAHATEKKVTVLDVVVQAKGPMPITNPTIFSAALPNGMGQVPADSPGKLTVKSFAGDHMVATWSSGGEKKTMQGAVPHAFDVTFDVTFH